ncbi:hypothetical protein LJC06_01200 [Bacteroidales bacterium OttesenSCG-928-I14]|nr:hypothetical protein [Bacteroidales bacterium OttesenSCG-928-I14]
MRIIKYLFIAAFYTLMLSGCGLLCSDEKFTIEKKDYNGKEFRIDGYYYYLDSTSMRMSIKFFYHNGIVFSGGIESSELTEIENYLLNDYMDSIRDSQGNWSLFQVDKSEVITESYYDNPPSACLDLMKTFYEIKNDTTLIRKRVDHPGYKNDIYNHVYHFKQFDHKPDSINDFIK